MTKFDYDFISYAIAEDRRSVMKNNLWGFIDTDFNLIVEPKYIEVMSYKNGFCGVKTSNGWGFIDINGRELCTPEFDYIFPFTPEGYAIVAKNFEYNIIDSNGTLIFENYMRSIRHLKDYCYLLNTTDGQKLFLANHGTQLNDIWDNIRVLPNTLIAGTNGKFGLIDYNGNYILPQEYEGIKSISSAHFSVKKDGKYAVYNIEKNILSDFIFDSIRSPSDINQPALLVKINLKFGLIDSKTLKLLTPVIYDDISEITIKDNITKVTVVLNSKPGFIYIK